MVALSIGALVGTAFAGWVAGMWTHKRAQRWCPHCGATLTCPACPAATTRSTIRPVARGGR